MPCRPAEPRRRWLAQTADSFSIEKNNQPSWLVNLRDLIGRQTGDGRPRSRPYQHRRCTNQWTFETYFFFLFWQNQPSLSGHDNIQRLPLDSKDLASYDDLVERVQYIGVKDWVGSVRLVIVRPGCQAKACLYSGGAVSLSRWRV